MISTCICYAHTATILGVIELYCEGCTPLFHTLPEEDVMGMAFTLFALTCELSN